MLKGNVLHSKALLQKIRENHTGVFLYDASECSHLLLNVAVDFDNVILSSDKRTPCNFFISNGDYFQDLFYVSDASVDKANTDLPRSWESVCGYCSANTYAYGINEGKLYQLRYNNNEISTTQVGSASTWTSIAGYSDSSTYYAYGIAGGKLYRISGSSTTQVGSASNWTMITGYSDVYGIAGGKLYKITNTTASQIGSLTNWTEFSGTLGLCDGKLYCVYLNSTLTQYVERKLSENGNWTSINGSFAISDGKLYHLKTTLSGRSLEQVGTDTTWEDVLTFGGISYGINKGVLYKMESSGSASVQKCLDIQRCMGIHYIGLQDPYKLLAICNTK